MDNEPRLRDALRLVTGSSPTRSAVRVVVRRMHQRACAYLRRQQQDGALREDLLGGDVADLAMDAIATLFERTDDGRFPELQRYFADCDLDTIDLPSLEHRVDRLVMGAVTDWCFEAYRAADRSLSNLLRALKRTAKDRDDVCLNRRGSTLWLEPTAPSSNGTTSPPPRMPMEVLEAYLTGVVKENPSTAELLETAVTALRTHPAYDSAYPLTRLAQVMRSARVRVQAVTDHDAPVTTPDWPPLQPDEIESIIDECVDDLRRRKRSTYVGTGKIEASVYEAYVQALRDRLRTRLVPNTPDRTHYEALSTHLPSLSKEHYRNAHRARFEYLVQLAQDDVEDRLHNLVQ